MSYVSVILYPYYGGGGKGMDLVCDPNQEVVLLSVYVCSYVEVKGT